MSLPWKSCLKRLARIIVAGDRTQTVLFEHVDEPLDGLSRIEWRPLALIHDAVEQHAVIAVPVRDAETRIVVRAGRHVHERKVFNVELERANRDAPVHAVHDLLGGERIFSVENALPSGLRAGLNADGGTCARADGSAGELNSLRLPNLTRWGSPWLRGINARARDRSHNPPRTS